MPLRVTLAGRVAIEVDGMPVPTGGLGGLAGVALAYLVCERHRPVQHDELADVLWGEALPGSWEQMVRGLVSKVRAVFRSAGLDPTRSLRAAPGVYQLHLPHDATVDVEEAAEAVRRAVDVLRSGTPEDAYHDAAAAAAVAAQGFVPGSTGIWVEQRQAELRTVHATALETMAQAAAARGDWTHALAAAEKAVELEPFREPAYVTLIVANAGAGRRADALRAYERCRAVLVEQLGLSPSPVTEAAYLAVLNDDEAPSGAPLASAQSPLPRPLAAIPAGSLVGRDNDVARLENALALARSTGPRAVFVSGEQGIGKTALLVHAARQAHARGTRVLYGRCIEQGGSPYQPFAEAFGHFLASCDEKELAFYVDVYGSELARWVPELSRAAPATTPAAADPEAGRYRLFQSVSAFIADACSASPMLLVLDDLHWAEPGTLLLLRHLLHSEAAALLVVGTYRPSDVRPDEPLAAALADLRREPTVERLAIHGLDERAVTCLVEEAHMGPLGEEERAFARALHSRTAGNPFFIGELLRHLAELGMGLSPDALSSDVVPDSVREVVARRLSRLSERANRALVLASVLGMQFDLDPLERLVEPEDADGCLDALDEAVRCGVITELSPGRYQFVHTILRDTVYSGLTVTRRARLHRRVGQTIESLPGPIDRHLPALAHHFAEAAHAGAAVEAARYAALAARQAHAEAAWEEAAAHIGRGLHALEAQQSPDLALRCDLLLLLAETWTRFWDMARSVQAAKEAAEIAEALGSPERLAQAARWYNALWPRDRVAAEQIAVKALGSLGESEQALRSMVTARLASVQETSERAHELSKLALDLAREAADREALGVALSVRCWVLSDNTDPYERLAIAEELVTAAPPDGWDGWRTGYQQRAAARLVLGDRAGFVADAAEVARIGAEHRFWYFQSLARLWEGTQALLDGRFGDVAPALSARSPREIRGAAVVQRFRVQFERGHLEECKAILMAGLSEWPGQPAFSAMLACTDAELGNLGPARRRFDELAAGDFAAVEPTLLPVTLAYLADVAALLGDPERALIVHDRLQRYGRQVVASGVIAHCPGVVDRFLGQLAATMGRWDEAEARFEAAVPMDAALASPPLLARTSFCYGQMLLDRGASADGHRARELLTHALDIASGLQMSRLADRARDLRSTVMTSPRGSSPTLR